jgi:hypothetical protein
VVVLIVFGTTLSQVVAVAVLAQAILQVTAEALEQVLEAQALHPKAEMLVMELALAVAVLRLLTIIPVIVVVTVVTV